MKKIKLFKIELTRIFGGWVETDDMIYGFYGVIPAWLGNLKYNIKKPFTRLKRQLNPHKK